MLVISREVNEQIVIGKDLIITVVEVRGEKVRLGINMRDIGICGTDEEREKFREKLRQSRRG